MELNNRLTPERKKSNKDKRENPSANSVNQRYNIKDYSDDITEVGMNTEQSAGFGNYNNNATYSTGENKRTNENILTYSDVSSQMMKDGELMKTNSSVENDSENVYDYQQNRGQGSQGSGNQVVIANQRQISPLAANANYTDKKGNLHGYSAAPSNNQLSTNETASIYNPQYQGLNKNSYSQDHMFRNKNNKPVIDSDENNQRLAYTFKNLPSHTQSQANPPEKHELNMFNPTIPTIPTEESILKQSNDSYIPLKEYFARNSDRAEKTKTQNEDQQRQGSKMTYNLSNFTKKGNMTSSQSQYPNNNPQANSVTIRSLYDETLSSLSAFNNEFVNTSNLVRDSKVRESYNSRGAYDAALGNEWNSDKRKIVSKQQPVTASKQPAVPAYNNITSQKSITIQENDYDEQGNENIYEELENLTTSNNLETEFYRKYIEKLQEDMMFLKDKFAELQGRPLLTNSTQPIDSHNDYQYNTRNNFYDSQQHITSNFPSPLNLPPKRGLKEQGMKSNQESSIGQGMGNYPNTNQRPDDNDSANLKQSYQDANVNYSNNYSQYSHHQTQSHNQSQQSNNNSRQQFYQSGFTNKSNNTNDQVGEKVSYQGRVYDEKIAEENEDDQHDDQKVERSYFQEMGGVSKISKTARIDYLETTLENLKEQIGLQVEFKNEEIAKLKIENEILLENNIRLKERVENLEKVALTDRVPSNDLDKVDSGEGRVRNPKSKDKVKEREGYSRVYVGKAAKSNSKKDLKSTPLGNVMTKTAPTGNKTPRKVSPTTNVARESRSKSNPKDRNSEGWVNKEKVEKQKRDNKYKQKSPPNSKVNGNGNASTPSSKRILLGRDDKKKDSTNPVEAKKERKQKDELSEKNVIFERIKNLEEELKEVKTNKYLSRLEELSKVKSNLKGQENPDENIALAAIESEIWRNRSETLATKYKNELYRLKCQIELEKESTISQIGNFKEYFTTQINNIQTQYQKTLQENEKKVTFLTTENSELKSKLEKVKTLISIKHTNK